MAQDWSTKRVSTMMWSLMSVFLRLASYNLPRIYQNKGKMIKGVPAKRWLYQDMVPIKTDVVPPRGTSVQAYAINCDFFLTDRVPWIGSSITGSTMKFVLPSIGLQPQVKTVISYYLTKTCGFNICFLGKCYTGITLSLLVLSLMQLLPPFCTLFRI